MKKIEVDCTQVMGHICESLNEDLDSPKCQAIKEHLSGCKSCETYFQSVEKTIDFYRKYEIEMPEDSHKKLMKMLGLEEFE